MKQKLTALLLVLCMVMAFIPAMAVASAAEETTASGGSSDAWDVWDGTVATGFADSSEGTESDPILVQSAAEFMYLRSVLTSDDTNGKYYQLDVNLDMNGKAVSVPNEGGKATAITGFAGTFDGVGNTIKNIKDTISGQSGLFYIITATGTVKNLTVTDSSFDSGWTNKSGVICSQLTGGVIENCHVKNTSVAGGCIGGISSSAMSGATIRKCTVDVTLAIKVGGGTNCSVGGITGGLDAGTISDCVVDGQFKDGDNNNGIGGYFGGIAGSVSQNTNNYINNCVNNATIKLTYAKATKIFGAGGIVGAIGDWGKANLQLANCTNNGAITVGYSAPVGGIIGVIKGPNGVSFEDCNNTATVSAVGNGTSGVGGIIGYVYSTNSNDQGAIPFTRCKNSGTIIASGNNVGGFIGLHSGKLGNWTFSECANTGNVSGANYVGGLVGQTSTNTGNAIAFINCSLSAVVTATGQYAGLVAGGDRIEQAKATLKIENSVLQGNVKAAGSAAAVVGAVDGTVATPNVTLTKAYVQATVTVGADAQAGTIAGGAPAEAITGVNLTVTDSAFAIDVTIGDAKVETPNTYYNYAGEGTVVALDVLSIADLKNGAVVKKLNTGLETALWAQGTNAPELIAFYVAPEVPEIGIDGASLTIGRNVTLNLFIKAATVAEAGVTVKTISIVNNDGETVATGVLNGGTYVFAIEGLKAAEFGANKVYKVQYTTEDAPETPVTCTESITYSPLQYAINMYGKTDKTGLDALLLSIVNYADAAAGTTTAKAAFDEKHADADWTAVTALAEIVKEDTGNYTYNAETMPGIGASLTETIALTVYLKDTAYTGVTMKVGDTELTGTADEATQTVKFEGFWATDLYNEITLTFTGAEETEPLEATISLVQYLNRYAGDATYAKVATATAQYLYAARNFCLKNQPNA